MNRAERRAQNSRGRRETRRLKKVMEKQALKRFTKLQQELARPADSAAEDYAIK